MPAESSKAGRRGRWLNAHAPGADDAHMRRLLLLIVAGLLAPGIARATAGFAEQHSQLDYTDLAAVHWIHPGDGCDCGAFCFELTRRGDRFARFPGLECSLTRLSVPVSPRQTLLVAQCCSDSQWVVYDLAHEQVLARTADRGAALAAWGALGLPAPRFAEAAHGARGLHQTWASRAEDWAYLALMWLPMLLPLLLVLGLVRFVVELRRYLATRRVIHLMWCVVLLLPALSVVWFFLRVVLGSGHLAGR